MKVQKILVGRRVSLPEEWMKEQDMKVGDWVIIRKFGKGIEIIPAEIVPRKLEACN